MSADTSCPRCGGPIVFVEDSTKAFGWRYRCGRGRQRISRQEARKRHSTSTVRCSGYVSATTNTWFAGCRHLYRSLSLLFCWLAWLPVTVSSDAAQCDRLLTTTAWPERCAKWSWATKFWVTRSVVPASRSKSTNAFWLARNTTKVLIYYVSERSIFMTYTVINNLSHWRHVRRGRRWSMLCDCYAPERQYLTAYYIRVRVCQGVAWRLAQSHCWASTIARRNWDSTCKWRTAAAPSCCRR